MGKMRARYRVLAFPRLCFWSHEGEVSPCQQHCGSLSSRPETCPHTVPWPRGQQTCVGGRGKGEVNSKASSSQKVWVRRQRTWVQAPHLPLVECHLWPLTSPPHKSVTEAADCDVGQLVLGLFPSQPCSPTGLSLTLSPPTSRGQLWGVCQGTVPWLYM